MFHIGIRCALIALTIIHLCEGKFKPCEYSGNAIVCYADLLF